MRDSGNPLLCIAVMFHQMSDKSQAVLMRTVLPRPQCLSANPLLNHQPWSVTSSGKTTSGQTSHIPARFNPGSCTGGSISTGFPDTAPLMKPNEDVRGKVNDIADNLSGLQSS